MTRLDQKPRARLTRQQSRERIVAAAAELVGERSYAELNVGDVMERAGLERTVFYRHFENLGDLLLGAAREAMEELFEAQLALVEHGAVDVREALELPVSVYQRHGPLLRAVVEAAESDSNVAAAQEEIRRRFDGLVARALKRGASERGFELADPSETARALNLLNESYLLDSFGRDQRVSVRAATDTLSEIWIALINRPRAES